MHRILSGITDLDQHFHALFHTPVLYRPSACPRCGFGTLWRHGYYYRKADRYPASCPSRNPVPILRCFCPACLHTCSRVPQCVAPRGWYNWEARQRVLSWLLHGVSLRGCSRRSGLARHTLRRWWQWLNRRSDVFAFHLKSRFPEWGRSCDSASFWRLALDRMPLAEIMTWLNHDLVVP